MHSSKCNIILEWTLIWFHIWFVWTKFTIFFNFSQFNLFKIQNSVCSIVPICNCCAYQHFYEYIILNLIWLLYELISYHIHSFLNASFLPIYQLFMSKKKILIAKHKYDANLFARIFRLKTTLNFANTFVILLIVSKDTKNECARTFSFRYCFFKSM